MSRGPTSAAIEARCTALFSALASPARRRMLDLLRDGPGMTIAALSGHFEMSGVAVLKHVRVLEAAGLVVSRREGRVRRLFLNLVPIREIYDRWTDTYGDYWAGELAGIKARAEARAVGRSVKRA